MTFDHMKILEMLSFIYEDLDIDTVEKRFMDFTSEIFDFDRLALLFVKHKKGILQGKLSRGFDAGIIENIEIPLLEKYLFSSPLITGLPVWNERAKNDQYVQKLGLSSFALIPIVNKKRIPCWQINACEQKTCPAFGSKWLRCWLVPNTQCSNGLFLDTVDKQERCEECPVYHDQSAECVEGVLLADKSISGSKISEEEVTMLSLVGHTVGVAIDNSKRFERTLRVAIKDDLTGLHNRRYFNERLVEEFERVKRYPEESFTLVMIDLDFFKKINDLYGHPRGDEVLIWFAETLQRNLRKSDLTARYGGEEFAILLINTTKSKALEIAEEIRNELETSSEKATGGIKLTASFGVATLKEDANSFERLILKADKALYSAKAQGRNRVCAANSDA